MIDKEIKELLLDILDTANTTYADEAETERLKYIENVINEYMYRNR